ncbi:MAG: type II secretion system F family protein, partial [Planctomycetaceae bacterium]|nr:type II secretion system F family protein [Planctomycetaceae bacterium]
MPVFTYEAMDNSGLEVKEEIEAPSEEEARQMIREKGFYPTRISEKSTRKKKDDKGKKRPQAGGKPKKAFTIGGVSAKKLTQFTRQLSTLQDAGLPILRSLRILEGQEKPGALKNSLMGVIEDVESGNTLSEAMAKQPKAF